MRAFLFRGALMGLLLFSSSVAYADSDVDSDPIPEVIVTAHPPTPGETVKGRMEDAKSVLDRIDLEYVFVRSWGKDKLRGRPVIFAAWSEREQKFHTIAIETPIPTPKWEPGKRPIPFRLVTEGYEAVHVRGTGAERLMFQFAYRGERLKVLGRKFPVFDAELLRKKKWKELVATATPTTYLPFTEDAFDRSFVDAGRAFLHEQAKTALAQLREAKAYSRSYYGMLLSDVISANTLVALAVDEQTDDRTYRDDQRFAIESVIHHYGLMGQEAFRYSVSSANAVGPMQFTDRKGNGTYSLVVRACPEARIDPDFERGATDIVNSMKAAACLLDLELSRMPKDVKDAYIANPDVLGIFPVAAYNGGPKNVGKFYRWIKKAKIDLEHLRPAPESTEHPSIRCPCLWRELQGTLSPISIPSYNDQNRWYVEKYLNILRLIIQ